MKSIGVIGHGFVGNALSEGMRHCFKVCIYDKKYDVYNGFFGALEKRICIKDDCCAIGKEIFHKIDIPPIEWLINNCDGPIFVCVPTPMNPDGSCDTSIVENVVKNINSICEPPDYIDTGSGIPNEPYNNFAKRCKAAREYDLPELVQKVVIIKSTVIPGTTERLNKECQNIQVCFNPEFLTEANAIDDFKNQDRIIIGGPRPATSIVKQMYQQAYPKVPVTKTGSTTAEMIKYVTNCFLATKVSFANEVKQICDNLDIDYDKVIEYATKDKRLGNSHWAVPGPMPSSDGSGELLAGFSGSCLVKDLNALIKKAEQLEVDPKVMNAVWQKNLEVRPEKDWEKLVGRAVSKGEQK